MFAQMTEDTVNDKIPLIEIKMVREMIDAEDEGRSAKDKNEFMIETNADGYNSGRTYYLQADSRTACRDIANKISENSRIAIEKDNAKTALAQARQQVRKIYTSAFFQNPVAFLILMVSIFPVSLKQSLSS